MPFSNTGYQHSPNFPVYFLAFLFRIQMLSFLNFTIQAGLSNGTSGWSSCSVEADVEIMHKQVSMVQMFLSSPFVGIIYSNAVDCTQLTTLQLKFVTVFYSCYKYYAGQNPFPEVCLPQRNFGNCLYFHLTDGWLLDFKVPFIFLFTVLSVMQQVQSNPEHSKFQASRLMLVWVTVSIYEEKLCELFFS